MTRDRNGPVLTGQQFGNYVVRERIGVGGMGEVYRAHDTDLRRDVAIKVLSGPFANDPDRLARFEREARVLASLNHPHIGAIHGLVDAAGARALVLELVDGETLAERIRRGPVALADVLSIARQIADALEVAHDKGIVHRDLKPANIKITPEGTVKVLDFGLAKASGKGLLDTEHSQLITQSIGDTKHGVIVGTVAYMSPEQARGAPVDKRADIWAFGCVLYEMLAGRTAFGGDTATDTIAAVLERVPDWSALPASTPASIVQLLERCLAKDSRQRLRDIGEARVVIDTEIDRPSAERVAPVSSRGLPGDSRSLRWAPVVIATAVLLAAGLGFIWWRNASVYTQPLRAVPLTSLPGVERHPSFSPDGNQVVFTWNGPRQENFDIYVHQIGAGSEPLRLTTDSRNDYSPTWSPDGRWIAFLRGDVQGGRSELRLVPPLGGPERKVADVSQSTELLRSVSVAWCPDSTCLILPDWSGEGNGDALIAVSVESREKRRLTRAGGNTFDTDPVMSPDGRWLVFLRNETPAYGEPYRLALGPGPTPIGQAERLREQPLKVTYLTWMPDSSGIVFSSFNGLWRLPLSGSAAPSQLSIGEDSSMPAVSSPRQGGLSRLAYVRSYRDSNIWRIDTPAAGGHATAAPVATISSSRLDLTPQFSPDGTRVAFTSWRSGAGEIWTADIDGSNAVQLTAMGAVPGFPRWSPDGRRIAFHSDAEQHQAEVFVVAAAGGKPRNVTVAPTGDAFPGFSSDGNWIYFTSNRGGGERTSIWKMPSSGGPAVQIAQGLGTLSQTSADGAYVYYLDNWNRSGALWRVAAAGGPATKVLDGVLSSNFALTKAGIYYIDQAAPANRTDKPSVVETRLQYFDFSTERSRIVAGNLGEVGFGLTASPDGRTILYTRFDSSIDDLMLADNFR
jgi:eukaryotic-like serine/threonine-protein kinase